MAQQHSTFEPNRKTTKVLDWEQQWKRYAEQRAVKNKVHAKRQRIAEAMESKGLTYRDR